MPSKKIVSVIGAGFGRHVHVPAFNKQKNCQVISICASTANKTKSISKEMGLVPHHLNWKSVMSDPRVNTVSIAVPPNKQFDIASSAFKAKKNVLLEKPLGLNAKESKKLCQLAKKNRVNCLVDFELPLLPVFQKAKAALDQNKIGIVRDVHVQWSVEIYAIRMGLRNWKTNSRQGGGTLFSFGSHAFHYLEWLFGPIDSINAKLGNAPDLDNRANSQLRSWIHFRSGASGTLGISSHAPCGGHRIDIYGSKGRILIENKGPDHVRDFKLYMAKSGQSLKLVPVRALTPSALEDGRIMAVFKVIEELFGHEKSSNKKLLGLETAHRVQVLMEKVLESNRIQREVICRKKSI